MDKFDEKVIGYESTKEILRQILEWQRDMSDNREFLNLIKGSGAECTYGYRRRSCD